MVKFVMSAFLVAAMAHGSEEQLFGRNLQFDPNSSTAPTTPSSSETTDTTTTTTTSTFSASSTSSSEWKVMPDSELGNSVLPEINNACKVDTNSTFYPTKGWIKMPVKKTGPIKMRLEGAFNEEHKGTYCVEITELLNSEDQQKSTFDADCKKCSPEELKLETSTSTKSPTTTGLDLLELTTVASTTSGPELEDLVKELKVDEEMLDEEEELLEDNAEETTKKAEQSTKNPSAVTFTTTLLL